MRKWRLRHEKGKHGHGKGVTRVDMEDKGGEKGFGGVGLRRKTKRKNI